MSEPISSINWKAQERAGVVSSQEKEIKTDEKRKQAIEASKQPAETVDYSSAIPMTSVQFQVNEATKDVVIFIRDKESDQVLRTIPADAIKDLPPGQLLNISS
ncbi:MAG: flagellar protein FlaG [Anaerolineaceae bacterium]